jgi:hypothetical protein
VEGLRRDASHRYWLGSHLFPVSITGVLAHSKSAYAMAAIEATREVWEPRGLTCHTALELWLTVPSWTPYQDPDTFGPYLPWIEPLLSHAFWRSVRPIASECMTCSHDLNLAGTYDGAAVTAQGRRLLFDLKSQERANAGRYCTKAQMGGYLVMEAARGIHYDGCVTIWARPGKTQIQTHDAADCVAAWWKPWEAYCADHRQF